MRVNVIRSPDPDMAARAMLTNSARDQGFMEVLKNNYQNFMNRMGEIGGNFVNMVSDRFNYIVNNDIVANTKRLLTMNEHIVDNNIIHSVNEDNIGRAGYMMRRYIMAEPTVYNLYAKNRCSGYDDEWYDPEPEIKNPYWRDDYLNAVDQVMQWDGNGDGYVIEYLANDNPLTHYERVVVSNTWDLLKNMIANDIDPTDEHGSKL